MWVGAGIFLKVKFDCLPPFGEGSVVTLGLWMCLVVRAMYHIWPCKCQISMVACFQFTVGE